MAQNRILTILIIIMVMIVFVWWLVHTCWKESTLKLFRISSLVVWKRSPSRTSMISYPIINKDQIIGLIYMDFLSPKVFYNEQRSLVNTIADMAGNALNRMISYPNY